MAYKQMVRSAACLVAGAALVLASGCSSLPPIDRSKAVYLETDLTGLGGLEVDVDGNPDTRPGALAAEGFVASVEGCDILFWACALIIVPAGAATGAVITAIETLPEEDALALNRVTTDVVSRAGMNLDIDFDTAMRNEAERHGIVLKNVIADVSLYAYVSEVFWNVGVGNNVAIEATFTIRGHADGKSGQRSIKIVSDSAKVQDWVSGTGERIEEALTVMVAEASVEIWRRILDDDDKKPD